MREHLYELLSERMHKTEIHQLFMLREKALRNFAINMLLNLDNIPDYEELKRKAGYIDGIEDCILTLRGWMRETGRYDIKMSDECVKEEDA